MESGLVCLISSNIKLLVRGVFFANASDKFSGAEIEQAVVAAIYAAFAKKTPLTSNLILEEIKQTKPLSILMAEKINYLRSWAAERTVPAD
jgi:hypothetical protein